MATAQSMIMMFLKTGDDTPIGLWLAIMIAAMAAAGSAVAVSRRRRKEQE